MNFFGSGKNLLLTGVLLASVSLASAQGTSARILMFHDVSFTDGRVGANDDVYPDNFRDMMEFLDRRYNVISMDQLIAWRQGSGSIPTNAVVITFDDNYKGTHDFALPIMAELGQKGINFAHTGFVGILTSKDHADWNELRAQEAGGVLKVESHTVSHPNLSTLSNQAPELQNSKSAIQAQIPGKTVRYLANPFGAYNSTTISLAQSSGYTAAVSTIGGLNTLSTPIYELRRNGIGLDIRLKDFKSIMGYTGSDSGGPVIVDNQDSQFTTTGTWSTNGSKSVNYGHYGTNYRRAARSTSQTATARFSPSLASGLHDVYSWHSSEADPYQTTADATYRVRHAGGTTTKTVNQRIDKAGWYYLGRYTFNSGTGGYAEISNAGSTGTYVSADAIKFQPVNASTPQPVASLYVDNSSLGFSKTGSSIVSSSGFPYGVNSHIALGGNNNATATATWSGTVPKNGFYDVGVWYTTSNSTFRNTSVPYTVSHADGMETVLVNQQSSVANDKRFRSLGTFRFTAGTKPLVVMSNAISSSTQYVSADAVRLEFVADAASSIEVVVDNTDSGFNASSNWFLSTSTPGYFGANYRARATASTSDAATWNVALPSSGSYEVYARWAAGSNRATAAPYIVYHNGGTTSVPTNQQINGGTWNSLGTFNFNSGSATRVALSCWTSSGAYVIADSVRFVKR
ncbi:MAG: polysaccharide deacetylase family protein [Sumerlaeia bacterium]